MKDKKIREKRTTGTENAAETDLVWGLNTVCEVLESTPRKVREVLVLKGKVGSKYQQIIDLARSSNIRLRFVDTGRLGVPASSLHQGVAARLAPVGFLSLEELLDSEGAQLAPQRILVLDSIQDPHNLGAICRSALAAGFGSMIMTRERSAPLSGTVAKTSAGALSQMRICQVVNLAETLKMLRKHGYWIYGTVAESNATSLYSMDFAVPLCLVVGSEGKGIRPLVRQQCDQLVTIPMQGNFNSLNVSVAAGVIMFEIVRRLRPNG